MSPVGHDLFPCLFHDRCGISAAELVVWSDIRPSTHKLNIITDTSYCWPNDTSEVLPVAFPKLPSCVLWHTTPVTHGPNSAQWVWGSLHRTTGTCCSYTAGPILLPRHVENPLAAPRSPAGNIYLTTHTLHSKGNTPPTGTHV